MDESEPRADNAAVPIPNQESARRPARAGSLARRGRFEWSERYALDHGTMDSLHQEFVATVGALMTAGDDEIAGRLDAVLDHLRRHFEHETTWMQLTGFPGLHEHEGEHAEVVERARQARAELAGGDARRGRELACDLIDWFEHHAQTMDRDLAQWLRARQSVAPAAGRDELADLQALAASAVVHRLSLEGVPCVWREWGAGPPVVLAHGGTGSWLHWVRNIRALAAANRVLVPDMAGFGDSGDAPPGLGAAGQARLLCAGLHALVEAHERPALVGFSFGAVVSGLAALELDAAARGLLLVGAVGLGIDRGSPLPMRAWKHLPAGSAAVAEAHRHNLATLMLAHPESIGALALQVQGSNAHAARFYTKRTSHSGALAEALAQVRVPVGGIWGSADATAAADPARVAARLRALRPDASLDIIPDAGHWVQFEAAEQFNTLCIRWLDHLEVAGRSP